MNHSASTSVMCGELRKTMNVLENLKREITDRNNIMRYEINRLESSLSPLQRAKVRSACPNAQAYALLSVSYM